MLEVKNFVVNKKRDKKNKSYAFFAVHIMPIGLTLNNFWVMRNKKTNEYFWLAPNATKFTKTGEKFREPYFDFGDRFVDFRNSLNELIKPFYDKIEGK